MRGVQWGDVDMGVSQKGGTLGTPPKNRDHAGIMGVLIRDYIGTVLRNSHIGLRGSGGSSVVLLLMSSMV